MVVARALLEVGVRRHADQRHRHLLAAEGIAEGPELARDAGAGVDVVDVVRVDDGVVAHGPQSHPIRGVATTRREQWLSVRAEAVRDVTLDACSPLPTSPNDINGRVITPDDPDYDEARRVFFGTIDRRPAMIVRAADAADVARVIALARETGPELAVRSGGHSPAGHGVVRGRDRARPLGHARRSRSTPSAAPPGPRRA